MAEAVNAVESVPGAITAEQLDQLIASVDSKEDDHLDLNINITTAINLRDAALTRPAYLQNMGSNQTFSEQVSGSNSKPVTNQRSTGTCWLYSTLNILRQPLMKKYNLSAFQFNAEYLFFWHKYELCNLWLESIISTRHLPLDSQLVSYLLAKGCEDGSQFDSALNLIEKYGLLPAVCNDNKLHSLDNEVAVKGISREMNRVLNAKLREFAMRLRDTKSTKSTESEVVSLRKLKKQQMSEVHRVLTICFGKPITRFDWKYHDSKSKTLHCHSDLSPQAFYRQFVRPCYDISKLISLVHDPRNAYYRLITVEHYGNVVDGRRRRVEYINVPMEVMKRYTVEMVKRDRPCWFACDIGWHYYPTFGSLDLQQFDYQNLLGIAPVELAMNKKERLEYGASINSHSMVIVGYDQQRKDGVVSDDNQDMDGQDGGDGAESARDEAKMEIARWRVENSWGDKKGNKGYVMMTDEWFDEFVYQVVVEKEILPQDILDVLGTEPIVLSRWDPFAQ